MWTSQPIKILIVAFFDVHKHKRLLRQIAALKGCEITVAGFLGNKPVEGAKCVPIYPRFREMTLVQRAWSALLILIGRSDLAYRTLYDFREAVVVLKKMKFDLIIAHDFKPLPLVEWIGGTARNVLVNCHEFNYEMGTVSPIIHRFNEYLLKKYFTRYSHYITVSDGIAQEYQKRIGKEFQVITNAHDYVELSPKPVSSDRIRIIYHGLAFASRDLGRLIQVVDQLDDRFELHLMLTLLGDGHGRYFQRLRKACEKHNRVKIIPPVEPEQIVPFINQYDIGISIWPDTNVNQKYILPNKFFEFIQGRLMIATGPSIEMEKIIRRYDLGVVSTDFSPESMARLLKDISAKQIEYYKEQCHRYARELSSEVQMRRFRGLVDGILEQNVSPEQRLFRRPVG